MQKVTPACGVEISYSYSVRHKNFVKIHNRPDDGLIDKQKLVTCDNFVNFVLHDSVWNI
jgi:hypothetical protein